MKTLWGNAWDELFQLDTTGALIRRLREVPDAQFQTYATRDVAYIREHFFGADPALVELAKLLSDAKIAECFYSSRGGHEARKVYAAYRAALEHKGAPTVILAQTVKGYTLGKGFESKNANHQMKKLSIDEFKGMRELLGLPIPDSAFEDGLVPYGHPGADSPEVRYLQERRAALGGPAPARRVHAVALPQPEERAFKALYKGSGKQEMATTMAFVRLVKDLMRDKETGRRWVPIVPDEARTFGMESLFPSVSIYSPLGQTYEPVDRDQLMYYKEAKDGQILNEGITEAGAMADFIAAASSYATHGETMIPFYIFYSMFGWQRTGDQMWQLADQLGKGFIVGATAGRTTLTGEGLQHADGHSHLIASTNPASLNYDPAFAYEIAVIVKDGLRRMYGPEAENVFYYLTVYNEPKQQPAMPEGVEEGIVKGLYRFKEGTPAAADAPRIQLLGSGTAIHWVLAAQELLAADWGITADVWSATSWGELRRDALESDEALLRGEERVPYVTQALSGAPGPVLAVSDWMRAVPDQISQWVEQDWSSLGTDGFGLSDTREGARRRLRCRPAVRRGRRAGPAGPPWRDPGLEGQGGPGEVRDVSPRGGGYRGDPVPAPAVSAGPSHNGGHACCPADQDDAAPAVPALHDRRRAGAGAGGVGAHRDPGRPGALRGGCAGVRRPRPGRPATGSWAATGRGSPGWPVMRPRPSSCRGCPPPCVRWGSTTPRRPPG